MVKREPSAKYLADKEILTCLLITAGSEAPFSLHLFYDYISEYLFTHGVSVSVPAACQSAERSISEKEYLISLLMIANWDAPVSSCFDYIAEYLIDHGVRVSDDATVQGNRMEQLQDELNKACNEIDALNFALDAKRQEINILCAQMDVVRMIFSGQ